MKTLYSAEEDAVFFRFSDAKISESEEALNGLVVDYDSDGKIVGIEMLNASTKFSAEALAEFMTA